MNVKTVITFLAFFSLRLCLALLTGSSSISAAAASYKIEASLTQMQTLDKFKYAFREVSVFSGQKDGFSRLRRTKVNVLIITEEMRVSFMHVLGEVIRPHH